MLLDILIVYVCSGIAWASVRMWWVLKAFRTGKAPDNMHKMERAVMQTMLDQMFENLKRYDPDIQRMILAYAITYMYFRAIAIWPHGMFMFIRNRLSWRGK